jgi:hypothetical protein
MERRNGVLYLVQTGVVSLWGRIIVTASEFARKCPVILCLFQANDPHDSLEINFPATP